MADLDKSPHQIIDQSLRERLASLEATNDFHRETLNDISTSMKEVVKTQHVLANQKDEIHKLVRHMTEVQAELSKTKQDLFEIGFKAQTAAKQISELKSKHDAMANEVESNSFVVKFISIIATTIIVPMAIAIAMQYIQ